MTNSEIATIIRSTLNQGRTVFVCMPTGLDWPITGVKQKGKKLLGRYDGDYLDITGRNLYSTDRLGRDKVMIDF